MKSNKLLLPLFYDKVNLRVEGTKKGKENSILMLWVWE
jgi:hypothetical protein